MSDLLPFTALCFRSVIVSKSVYSYSYYNYDKMMTFQHHLLFPSVFYVEPICTNKLAESHQQKSPTPIFTAKV